MRRSGLLDTPAEETFDCFTRLAARLLRTSAAMVTLVDDARLFIKSSVGLAEPYATERQATLAHSFCTRVVETGAPVVVRDLTSDLQALYYPPELMGGGVTYLGVPVRAAGGLVVGALAVLDSAPREFGREEVAVLEELAAGVTALVAQHAARADGRRAEALEASAALFDAAEDGVARLDGEGVVRYWSPAAERLLGTLAGEATGRPLAEVLARRLPAEETTALLDAVRGSGKWTGEVALDGSGPGSRRLAVSLHGLAAPARGSLCYVTDVTDRARELDALRRSEALHRRMVEESADGIIVADREGALLAANDRACEMLGRTREALLALKLTDLDPDGPDAPPPLRFAVLKAGKRLVSERAMRRGDGADVHAEVSAWVLPDGRLVANLRDAAERSRAADVLRRELDRLRATTTTARLGEWTWEIESGAMTMSPLAAELHGDGPAPDSFDDYLARIHADDRSRVLRQIKQAVPAAASYEVEYRVATRDGTTRWVLMRAGVTRDDAGRALRIAGLCHDVTARRERELALQRMGAFLEGIVAHAPVAVVITNADGIVGLWNDEAERTFGWTPEDCIGAPMRIVPAEWAEDYRMVREALARGETVSGLETHALRRDGTLVHVSLAVVRLAEHAVELGSDVWLLTAMKGE